MDIRSTLLRSLVASDKVSGAFASECRTGWDLAGDWMTLAELAVNSGLALWKIKQMLSTQGGSLVPLLSSERTRFVYVPALCALYPAYRFYPQEIEND